MVSNITTLHDVAASGLAFWRNNGCFTKTGMQNVLGVGFILLCNNQLFKAFWAPDNNGSNVYWVNLFNSNSSTLISTASVSKINITAI